MDAKVIVIIVAITNPHGKESLCYYLNQMNQHYQWVGAKALGNHRIDQVARGTEKPEMVVVMKFPHESAFREIVEGEDYPKLTLHRNRPFKKLSPLILHR